MSLFSTASVDVVNVFLSAWVARFDMLSDITSDRGSLSLSQNFGQERHVP